MIEEKFDSNYCMARAPIKRAAGMLRAVFECIRPWSKSLLHPNPISDLPIYYKKAMRLGLWGLTGASEAWRPEQLMFKKWTLQEIMIPGMHASMD